MGGGILLAIFCGSRLARGGDPAELAAGAKATLKVTLGSTEVGTFERAFTILGTANRIQFELSAKVTRNPGARSACAFSP